MSGQHVVGGALTALELEGPPSVTVVDNDADETKGPAVPAHCFAGYRSMSSLQQVLREGAKARLATWAPAETLSSRPVIEPPPTQGARSCRVIEFVGHPAPASRRSNALLRKRSSPAVTKLSGDALLLRRRQIGR